MTKRPVYPCAGADWAPRLGAKLRPQVIRSERRECVEDHSGMPALLALCSALLGKSLCGGLITTGHLNLGGGLDPVHNAVDLAELAAEKRAAALLLPIGARQQLNDLSDDIAARLTILYYTDARDALLKALSE